MLQEYFEQTKKQFEFNDNRVKEFLYFTSLRWHKDKIKNKRCLDVGCGPGRWTYAMQKLGGTVTSFDVSEEAVKQTKKINPNTFVYDIENLKPDPSYDFVLAWGVLHHTPSTKDSFLKVCSQVKKGGILHVMVYNKENDWFYDGFRGDKCLEKHKEWELLSFEEKLEKCKDKARMAGGDTHGWFDAFNPKYNWSHTKEEVKKWFEEYGFSNIKIKMVKQNININGVL